MRFRNVTRLSERSNEVAVDDRLLSLSSKTGIALKEFDHEAQVRTGQELHRYWLVSPGQLVVNPMWVMHGAVAVSSTTGVISPDYRVYDVSPRIHAPFLHHLLRSNEYSSLYALLTRGTTTYDRRISKEDFHELPVIVPPVAEQRAIADFLDRKTAAIDALIAKKERLVELLQEKRQALITQAVTKGLDPSVAMKESGVEWIGPIPSHWQVRPVRRLFESLDGRRVPLETEERATRPGDVPYYGASGIIDTVDEYLFDEPLVLVCEDGWNLLLRSQPVARPLLGRAWVNNHAHVMRPHWGSVFFWATALEVTPFDLFVTGMRQPKLTQDALKDIPLAAPPPDETFRIGEVLARLDEAHAAHCSLLQRSCDRLREYRQALITAAVTGKIDVTKEAA